MNSYNVRDYLRLIGDSVFGFRAFREDMERLSRMQAETNLRLDQLTAKIAALRAGMYETEQLVPGPPLGGRWPDE